MPEHSPLLWTLAVESSQKNSKFGHCIYSKNKVVVGGRYASDYDHISLADMRFVVHCVNLHDELVKLVEHLKFEAKYSRDDGRWIEEVLAKAKGET